MVMSSITFFGTGTAKPAYCDNTYFMIENQKTQLFVDTGGGRELQKMVSQKIIAQPKHLFLTHCHTDHLLGLPHLLRVIVSPLTIYCSHQLYTKIQTLVSLVAIENHIKKLEESNLLNYVLIDENTSFTIDDRILKPINLHSSKAEQFGFLLTINDQTIVFFGDEAIDVLERKDLALYANPDILICEAFCCKSQESDYDLHKICHITAEETGRIANTLNAKKVFVTHYNEIPGIDRYQQAHNIQQEVASQCDAEVIVPLDGAMYQF